MNNSLYKTRPPELEYCPVMSPDEEMEHYLSVIEEPIDDFFNDEPIYCIRDDVASIFCMQADTQVNSIDRYGEYGLEVPKTATSFICSVLDLAEIEYVVKEAKYRNIYGHWTHKSFDFIVISDDDFRKLAQKLRDEIVIIGDDSL